MARLLNTLSNLFPVWVLLASGLALVEPSWFAWFSGPWITWGLAVIMLGMGVTLTLEDFRRVARHPWQIGVGFVAQFFIMPLLGWGIARLLQLDTPLAVGLILVACCPGGTASNVVAFIARADVALSVSMTLCSTLGAVVMTPLLTTWLASEYVEVPFWGLLLGALKVVVVPVVLGVVLNHRFPSLVKRVQHGAPLVSVVVIALICASIIGREREQLLESALLLFTAVTLLHVGGFALGYGAGRIFRLPRQARRTVSIEVGMQNSGLGTVLAQENFAQFALAPVPAAISATFHSVIGSVLAAWWRSRSGWRKTGDGVAAEDATSA